jgi:hypothetical protein
MPIERNGPAEMKRSKAKTAKKTANKPAKKGARPATGRAQATAVRTSPELRATIDGWASRQPDRPARSEAIRRLVELGLGSQLKESRNTKAAAKASDMAGQQIDRLFDPSASDAERQERKRRLLKGPKEFRDLRANKPPQKR